MCDSKKDKLSRRRTDKRTTGLLHYLVAITNFHVCKILIDLVTRGPPKTSSLETNARGPNIIGITLARVWLVTVLVKSSNSMLGTH